MITPPFSPLPAWNDLPSPWGQRFALARSTAPQHGLIACLVGGCVRDVLLKRTPKDWDIVVEGEAAPWVQELARLGNARIVAHPAFLTFTLHFPDGTALDIATARRETYPHPAALPVVTPATLAEDAARRDFSVNALYGRLHPNDGELLDPTGGLDDLMLGQLRTLHPASFRDDPTRLYRAARYAGRYGWFLEGATRQFIEEAVVEGGPALLSPVRRRNELLHLLDEDDPVPALRLAWDWGLWSGWSALWTWSDDLIPGLRSVSMEKRLATLCSRDITGAETTMRSLDMPRRLREKVLRHLPSDRRER